MSVQTLQDIKTILATAPRLGSDTDEPEGSRYIILSDTLSREMIDVLIKSVKNNVGYTNGAGAQKLGGAGVKD